MPDAYVVAARRSPIGRRRGALAAVHPADLLEPVLAALFSDTGVDPARVDDVIVGCVSAMGAQAGNVGRLAWLAAGLPESVPGTTVDRQCGSSQQALHFGAQGVLAGCYELVVAAGVEVMSLVPISSPALVGAEAGMGSPRESVGWRKRYGDEEISQFRAAELIAQRWQIERETMERFALRSHQRAVQAWSAGAFDDEIVPCVELSRDEGPRPTTSLPAMGALPPLRKGGRVTAAVSSQVSDGAAAVLIASERAVQEHGLTPIARIVAMSVVGSSPVEMLTGPIPATAQVLQRAGLTIEDVDLFEVNEAFASVVLAWLADTHVDVEHTNVLGGAIALGHPLGASGARLTTTLLHHMRRTGRRYGLQTMCEGGGTANATIFENCA